LGRYMRMQIGARLTRAIAGVALGLGFAAPTAGDASNVATASVPGITNPILFVTQVPTPGGDGFANRTATFANHIPGIERVPRGGDLMIRYPDGTLRNLTKEAGFGEDGRQGANGIAVREPSVHWSGTKALFSMLVGAPPVQYVRPDAYWQIYEVSGLGKNEVVSITKLPGQPASNNNVSPLYDTQDNVLFTSDRAIDGSAHLYPQLDEYESTPTITGLWRLSAINGQLQLLNHTPSGLFSPIIDSFGRVIFTRWDHLQRDQQADGAPGNGYVIQTFQTEAANSPLVPNVAQFPEERGQSSSPVYGPVGPLRFNLFQPWEMNQDGTSELTLNHIGRHELSFGYVIKSFMNDPALDDFSDPSLMVNRKSIGMDTGVFNIRESSSAPGTYYGIFAREFGSMSSGGILRFNGAPGVNAEQIAFIDASPAEVNGAVPGGRFRNPLPLTTGKLVSVHTNSQSVHAGIEFRLKDVVTGANGLFQAGVNLTPGISKSVSWWDPDNLVTFSGNLWELEPVEVVARARPTPRTSSIETIEKQVLTEENVDEVALRTWLKNNNLALIVTRNQTSRDRADKQQPYNLRVKNGVETKANNGKVYEIAHYQIIQSDMVRGYAGREGRRTHPRPMAQGKNPATTGPAGSVRIAADGSTAAFVPANRALAWQTTDAAGEPIVRERVWVTMQPGEIRTCAGCHGENSKNQVGNSAPTNKPQALRDLMAHWKTIAGSATALRFDVDGNGSCNAATDGLLVARYMSGIRGNALVQGLTFDSFAVRNAVNLIEPYLSEIYPELDIDGDGQRKTSTDALLFARYTRGVRAASLATAAKNPSVPGARTDAQIEAYLDTKCKP
jgi:Hydrazine synthase alpha subunit middle domain